MARTTLVSGIGFLRERAGALSISTGSDDDRTNALRSRYVGNCLAELDCFFHHLLDALNPAAPPRRHNAALKLSALEADHAQSQLDQYRLRAIGRSRACLRYCRGFVDKSDGITVDWMTAGWTDHATGMLRRYAIGDRLVPHGQDIVDVCSFYDALTIRLVDHGL